MRETLDNILGSIKDRLQGNQKGKFEDKQFLLTLDDKDQITLPIACAVLLSDVAMIDGHFDSREYEFLFHQLEKELGLSKADASDIVAQARAHLSTGRGASSYAEFAKNSFSLEQRQQIFQMIQGMVAADAITDGFETYLEQRFKSSLGL